MTSEPCPWVAHAQACAAATFGTLGPMGRRARWSPGSSTRDLGSHARTRSRRAERPSDPGTEWLRIAGLIVIALKLALLPVVFDPFGEDAFGVAKTAVSRAGMYLLLSIGGTLFALSADARDRLFRPREIVAGLVAFGASAALSTLLAVDRGAALFGVHHRYLGLTSIADGLVLACALPLFVARQVDLRWVFGGLFGGAAAVMGYAALQHVHLDPFSWDDPLTSTLGNRGVSAGYLVVIAAAGTCAAVLDLRSRWAIALGFISLAASVLVVRSGARGAILALPPAILVAGGVAMLAGSSTAILHRRAGIAAVMLLAVPAVLAGVGAAGPRLATLLSGGDTSLAERTLVYEAAIAMVAGRPLVGAGPDGFAVVYPLLRPAAAAQVSTQVAPGQSSAHSWPLHHAVGTGLLGVAALALLVAVSIRAALVGRPAAGESAQKIGAVIVVAFLLQGVFEIPNVGTEHLFWTGIGLTAVGPFAVGDEVARPTQWRWPSVAAGLVAVAVGLFLASTTGSWLEANRAVRSSDVLRSRGKLELAEQAALFATQRDPGRANNWNVLGLARSGMSASRALPAFERAWAAAPYDSRYLINVITEEGRLAETDPAYRERARVHARKLIEIDPRNAEARMVVSFVLMKTGDVGGARREADLAITLAPKDPQYYSWSAAIHEDTGDLATAAARYQTYAEMTTRGEMAEDTRTRLAGLYVRAGLLDRARALGKLRLASASNPCGTRCSQVSLRFSSPLGLATEGPGSALEASRYMVDGRRLPAGTVIKISDGPTVSIVAPSGAELVRPGSVIVITGLTDSTGLPIDPDPTTVVVQ